MIVFDIDDTISPTRPGKDWAVPHETHRAWGFDISIPSYVLDFLRTRDDIALLSTWGEAAVHVAEAFNFKAKILLTDPNLFGIKSKFEAVKELEDVTVWVDDHITPTMKKEMATRDVLAIKPLRGVISEKQLNTLIAYVTQD